MSDKLRENGINASAQPVLEFIKTAIEGRELGKFLFTRHLSQILKLVEELGQRYDFSTDQISHLNISAILELYSNLTDQDLPETIAASIKLGERLSQVSQAVKLPQLITNESEVYSFALSEVEPNYVTLARVTELIVLEDAFPQVDLSGKIVFIKSADPGYDWVFSRKIGGLVTMYGGANSHMAIRCAELKIPAVIGCGEINFESWSKARILDLDCANKRVRVVS